MNGLVIPTARSQGGFRLYSEDEVARLEVIEQTKPLGFSLEEMQELLTLLADLNSGTGDRKQLVGAVADVPRRRYRPGHALRELLAVAEGFAETLAGHLDARR